MKYLRSESDQLSHASISYDICSDTSKSYLREFIR